MDYAEFRQQYEERHPASVPVKETDIGEYAWWVRWAVLAVFLASAIVSGVHTVPTVWEGIKTGDIITAQVRDIASIVSLIMVEGAILLSAYLMAKGNRVAYMVMVISSVIAIAANLYALSKAFDTTNMGAVIVAILLGIGAPLSALLMGMMYVDIHHSDRVTDARSRKLYKEACIAWDKEIEKAWEKSVKTSGQEPVQPVHTVSVARPVDTPVRRNNDYPQTVRNHLAEHPEDLGLSVRELSAKLNIPKSTVHSIMQEFKVVQSNGHLNGHPNNGHES